MFLYFGQPTVIETATAVGPDLQKREPSLWLWHMDGRRTLARTRLRGLHRPVRAAGPSPRVAAGVGGESRWRP